MAPSRRKGASKAAAAAAARRQWKVGDLVLAKVKGFPAWPATVSEPEKWGYSVDWKKVLVYFFGTQQIAFCNPADVEPFTEEKKESLLLKRHGKGADFLRAVREIIECYDKSKAQEEQLVDATITSIETNNDTSIPEVDDNTKSLEDSLNKIWPKNDILRSGGGIKMEQDLAEDDEANFNSLVEVAASASASEKDIDMVVQPSKESRSSSNVVVTYSSRRKVENIQTQDCLSERRVQPTRRSRSSRHQMGPRENGDLTVPNNISSGRRSKRLRKSTTPDGSERLDVDSSPALVSNDYSETATLSDNNTVTNNSNNDNGITAESEYAVVVKCEPKVEFTQRLELQTHAFICKKKRKPNRKRSSNDTTESIVKLETIIPTTIASADNAADLPLPDHEKVSERNSKEDGDGDEHLPLVKRARVRMGTSPLHRPSSDNEQHESHQVAEVTSSSVSKMIYEENVIINEEQERDVSSPSNNYSVKKPQVWEVRKIQPFSSLVNDEAALPPSKRLHRALEAMSANVAENSQTSSDGPAVMNTSNDYCSSSSGGDFFKVAPLESREAVINKVDSPVKKTSLEVNVNVDSPKLVPLVEEESEEPVEEVGGISSDDSPKINSCENPIEEEDLERKQIGDASPPLSEHTADMKEDQVKEEEPSTTHDGSPGLIMQEEPVNENETSKLEPETQISWRSLDPPMSGEEEENSPTSQNCADSVPSSAPAPPENNKDQDVAMVDAEEESGPPVIKKVSPVKEKSITVEDQLVEKAATSATQSSSSVTDGLDSGPRASSPLNTPACNTCISDNTVSNNNINNNNNNNLENNGYSTPEAPPIHKKKPNLSGKRSSTREGTSGSLDSFEAVLGTLTRSKDSISKATNVAIDCVKLGAAVKVVEILTRKLETESSLTKKVNLFFLVDSITQFSRTLKGNLSGIYPSAIQTVLPRLLAAAAPPGTIYQENRRQCLKVLRVWQERRLLPESIIRHHIRELDSLCCSSSSGTNSRSCKTERAFDDPIREMEGMLVDEYGSNSSIQLLGFRMPPMLRDGDEGSESDEETFEAVTPERRNNNKAEINGGSSSKINNNNNNKTEIEKKHNRHILEDVDGELEMEDVAPSCEPEITTISSVVVEGTAQAKYNQFAPPPPPLAATSFAPPVPKDIPPSSPPLPVSPPPSMFPPPAASNSLNSGALKIKDDVTECTTQQQGIITSNGNSSVHHHGPDGRDFHGHSSYNNSQGSRNNNNICDGGGALQKSYHLPPPHPIHPTNQFSYVHPRDLPPPPHHNRHHLSENGDFYREHRSRTRAVGDRWRSPAPPFSGPCHPDIARRPYGPASFPGPPREHGMPSHRWDYPPREVNRREFIPHTHRPPPGGPIPVSSRGPNYWRPR